MKTVSVQLTAADEHRMERIRELRTSPNGFFHPTDEEILRVALITYCQAAEEDEAKKNSKKV